MNRPEEDIVDVSIPASVRSVSGTVAEFESGPSDASNFFQIICFFAEAGIFLNSKQKQKILVHFHGRFSLKQGWTLICNCFLMKFFI